MLLLNIAASVLEYLSAELLELAGNVAIDQKKHRIIPRHILLAVRNDEELNKLFHNVTIPQGGVVPSVHSALLAKRNKHGHDLKKGRFGESENIKSQDD
jgi:histone H2A